MREEQFCRRQRSSGTAERGARAGRAAETTRGGLTAAPIPWCRSPRGGRENQERSEAWEEGMGWGEAFLRFSRRGGVRLMMILEGLFQP